MLRIPGFLSRIMISLFKKETTYNGGVTMNSTNAAELYGFDSDPPDWPDETVDDTDTTNGTEFATTQEIIRQKLEFSYSEPKAKPNTIIGLSALCAGQISSVQDGALAAYRHLITPIAPSTDLPSVQAEFKAGTQWAFTGVKAKSFTIHGKEDGSVGFSASLVGSGSRATSATAFAAKIIESWLKTTQMKVWLESAPDISISATPAQDAEDISSATPDDLKIRIRSFEFMFDNQLFVNFGYGSSVAQEIDKGARRKATLKFSLWYVDDAELNYYINQSRLAIEFDAKGALIAVGGTMYYGLDLIIPAVQLKPIPKKGKAGDFVTQDFEATIIDNGTDPIFKLYGYNAKTGYLS